MACNIVKGNSNIQHACTMPQRPLWHSHGLSRTRLHKCKVCTYQRTAAASQNSFDLRNKQQSKQLAGEYGLVYSLVVLQSGIC